MIRINFSHISLLIAILLLFGCQNDSTPLQTEEPQVNLNGPQDRFESLFAAVQLAHMFPDSKTFADYTPKDSDEAILKRYEEQKGQADFDLASFVEENFAPPQVFASDFVADTSGSVKAHIEKLWPVLTRNPDQASAGTLIPLPNEYIVPGGRFREIYYWDSYFTMLGLQVSETSQGMIAKMVDNFAYIIETAGFIPNGNRTYYLSRSQPPFFAMMVELLAEVEGDAAIQKYRSALEKEYQFWMNGQGEVSQENNAVNHVVLLPDGTILNRYFDNQPAPRPESYREDVILAKEK